jgi:COP9 signalosome complex subunit 3
MFKHSQPRVKRAELKICETNFDDFFFCFLGNFRELCEYLQESTELLAKNSNILDNVLDVLDFQQHSLGVVYILVAKISEITVSQWKSWWKSLHHEFSFQNEDPEPVIALVKRFVNVCNGEQVRNATQTCECPENSSCQFH